MSEEQKTNKPSNVSVVAVVGTRATGHVVILEVDERFYFTDDYSGSGLTPRPHSSVNPGR